jgi:hypothetical protein
MAAPMLRDPPVTSATFPLSFLIMMMLLCERVTDTQPAALHKSASPVHRVVLP